MKRFLVIMLVLSLTLSTGIPVNAATASKTAVAAKQSSQLPEETAGPTASPGEPTTEPSNSPTPSEEPTTEPTPTAQPEKTITEIEVIDTETSLPYGSSFDKSKITLLIHYSDNTTLTAKPDSISVVDTSKLGGQDITIYYGTETVTYTITVVPRQVTGVVMKNGTKTSMTVGWNALPEAEKYAVYTSASQNGTYTLETVTDKTEYTFEDMVPGRIIYVRVRAIGKDTEGADSDAKGIAPKPDKVTGVKATACVKTKVTLSWNAAAGATGYAVYYRLSTSSAYILGGTTTGLSFKVTGLTAGKDYYFIVYAYGADTSNLGEGSDAALYGTAPSIPTITKFKGGDKRVKVYWKKGSGATSFRIYLSTKSASGYTLAATVDANGNKFQPVDSLKQNKTYYVKVEAVRVVSGMTLTSVSAVSSAKTVKAKATSTKAKYYTTLKKFKKSAAYLKYKAFAKRVVYGKSFILPGMKVTNVAGFNSSKMVPQSITFAGKYLLISAYDYNKAQESVIYVMDKKTKKYLTTVVMPHTGHMGGIAYDGQNIWYTYSKNLHSFKFSIIEQAVASKKSYTEITQINSVCPMPETVSYVSYYKGKIWAGAYNEKVKKYMYGYTINNKKGVPSLTRTNKMLMPNRTQGVTFTSGGKMIISRSCQTKKGRSGFMSQLDTYKPTWNLSKTSVKKNKRKKVVKMPPMNEGIAINGSYTYVIYESSAFAECQAPMDRITAFKTTKIS